MKKTISIVPIVLGISFFFYFKNEVGRELVILIFQFVLLSSFAIMSVSWISRLVKINRLVFVSLGFMNLLLGLYVLYRTKNGEVSLPFFLLSSWSFFKST